MEKQKNRGPHSKDIILFGNEKIQLIIQEAIKDLSFLLNRGYGMRSSLELVGNRYRLLARQQKALQGMSMTKESLTHIEKHEINLSELKNKEIIIDGFNSIILLESALSNAFLFKGLDNCYRDLSSVHGTYKRVSQTPRAIQLIGKTLQQFEVKKVEWVLDKPISNSGKLKTLLREIAEENDYSWEIILDNNPDKILSVSDKVVITSDVWILQQTKQWVNIPSYIIENKINNSRIIRAN